MLFSLYGLGLADRFKPPAARLIAVYTRLVIAMNAGNCARLRLCKISAILPRYRLCAAAVVRDLLSQAEEVG